MAKRFIIRTTPRQRRHLRVRARVAGTPERPRLSVFRSAKHVVAQVIDDVSGITLAAASDREVQAPQDASARKMAIAHEVGKLVAARCQERGIASIVFDRGGYAYHGRVQAVAEGAREGGLTF